MSWQRNVSSDYLLGRTDNPSLSESDPTTVSERAEIEKEFLAAFEKLTERQKAIPYKRSEEERAVNILNKVK